jgi:hypothetical protein
VSEVSCVSEVSRGCVTLKSHYVPTNDFNRPMVSAGRLRSAGLGLLGALRLAANARYEIATCGYTGLSLSSYHSKWEKIGVQHETMNSLVSRDHTT